MGTQNPDIAAYDPSSAAFRNRVVHEALGKSLFTSLTADQQTMLAAAYDERFNFVYEVAKRIADLDGDGDDLPTPFQVLFYQECVFATIHAVNGPEAAERRKPELDRVWEGTLASYSPAAFASTTLSHSATSFDAIDRYVTAITVRLPRRVLIPTWQIDQEVRHCFSQIWNRRPWAFRLRHSTFTISSGGNLEGELAGSWDMSASRRLFYTDAPTTFIQWASISDVPRLRAHWWDVTARPRYYYVQDEGTRKTVVFIPKPDQQYEVTGSVYLSTPDLPNDRDATTGFSMLPREFHPILWDMVAGRLVERLDRDSGRPYLDRVERWLDAYGEEFDDMGRSVPDIAPVDVYRDPIYLGSWHGSEGAIGGL